MTEMRISFCLAVFSLILGIALLSWGKWEYAAFRWVPVDAVTIPSPNSKVQYEFYGGRGIFRVSVELPMSESNLTEVNLGGGVPPVLCNLALLVRQGSDIIGNLSVKILHHSGTMFSSRTGTFDDGTIAIPKAGHYVIELENVGDESVSSKGKLSLERDENAENAAFLAGFSGLFGWTLLVIGIVIAICYGVGLWRGKQMNLTRQP
jgi:hypothetical protein